MQITLETVEKVMELAGVDYYTAKENLNLSYIWFANLK